jgi:hypothetical protein
MLQRCQGLPLLMLPPLPLLLPPLPLLLPPLLLLRLLCAHMTSPHCLRQLTCHPYSACWNFDRVKCVESAVQR